VKFRLGMFKLAAARSWPLCAKCGVLKVTSNDHMIYCSTSAMWCLLTADRPGSIRVRARANEIIAGLKHIKNYRMMLDPEHVERWLEIYTNEDTELVRLDSKQEEQK
jgi:hypothetical protein